VHFIDDLGRAGKLLKIIPEDSSAKLCGYRGEAVDGGVESDAQNVSVDRLGERCGEAESIIPIASFCGGIYLRGIIELHPAKLTRRGYDAVDEGFHLDEIVFVLLKTIYGVEVNTVKNAVVKAAKGQAAFDRAVVISFE
jgi:hypothetical protein